MRGISPGELGRDDEPFRKAHMGDLWQGFSDWLAGDEYEVPAFAAA